MKLTIEHVIDLVDQLPKNNLYDYVSGGKNKAKLVGVNKSEQNLEIVRVNSDNTETKANMTKIPWRNCAPRLILTSLSNLIVFLTEVAIPVLHLRLYLHIQQSSMHVKLVMSST